MSENAVAYLFTDEDFEGFEGVQPEIRTCRIRQNDEKDQQGRVVKAAGRFVMSDGSYDGEVLSCIVLGTMPGRTWWPQGFGSGEPPYCSAPNGQVGVSRDPSYNGRLCEICPNSKFHDKKQPVCQRNVKVLCLDLEFKAFVLTLSESGIKPTDEWLVPLVHNRQMGPPMKWTVAVRLQYEPRPGSPGFYKPVWPSIGDPKDVCHKPLSVPQIQRVLEVRKQAMPMFKLIYSPPAQSTTAALTDGRSVTSPSVSTPSNGATLSPTIQAPVAPPVTDPFAKLNSTLANVETAPDVIDVSHRVEQTIEPLLETPIVPQVTPEDPFVSPQQVTANDPFARLG